MPEPIYWKSRKSEQTSGSLPEDRKWIGKLRVGAAIVVCIVFLGISWLVGRSSWLLFLLLYIPCYACGEWLSGKIFSENSRLSVSRSGFSVVRIFYGVIFASLLFGTIYVVGLLVSRWLL
jgi:hypothetical protein